MDVPEVVEEVGLQERVEGTRAGRWLISGLVGVVLVAALVSSLPGSEIRRVALPVFRPVLQATGLSQSWGMFAPDPPRRSTELVARVSYDDGTTDLWRPPRGEPVAAAYRTYHWRKWATAVLGDRSGDLRESAARWVAVNHDHRGRQPVSVELERRSQALPPPGSGEPPGPWDERLLYRLDLDRLDLDRLDLDRLELDTEGAS